MDRKKKAPSRALDWLRSGNRPGLVASRLFDAEDEEDVPEPEGAGMSVLENRRALASQRSQRALAEEAFTRRRAQEQRWARMAAEGRNEAWSDGRGGEEEERRLQEREEKRRRYAELRKLQESATMDRRRGGGGSGAPRSGSAEPRRRSRRSDGVESDFEGGVDHRRRVEKLHEGPGSLSHRSRSPDVRSPGRRGIRARDLVEVEKREEREGERRVDDLREMMEAASLGDRCNTDEERGQMAWARRKREEEVRREVDKAFMDRMITVQGKDDAEVNKEIKRLREEKEREVRRLLGEWEETDRRRRAETDPGRPAQRPSVPKVEMDSAREALQAVGKQNGGRRGSVSFAGDGEGEGSRQGGWRRDEAPAGMPMRGVSMSPSRTDSENLEEEVRRLRAQREADIERHRRERHELERRHREELRALKMRQAVDSGDSMWTGPSEDDRERQRMERQRREEALRERVARARGQDRGRAEPGRMEAGRDEGLKRAEERRRWAEISAINRSATKAT
ncbi:unnamed protein product [Ostreobium quekettii]|uniref:Uncharacterized protein n=1 Tax=Ostreobium quekettii TaxID=121088 RepID=A0A8S1J8X7_9CHLO|nr:unnamed protein product [Ostreobium quekettii]|eukprot:evm.model.scf_2537.3 EVM.evm.TU.scf_2537.3   scf_2537:10846-12372(-)